MFALSNVAIDAENQLAAGYRDQRGHDLDWKDRSVFSAMRGFILDRAFPPQACEIVRALLWVGFHTVQEIDRPPDQLVAVVLVHLAGAIVAFHDRPGYAGV